MSNTLQIERPQAEEVRAARDCLGLTQKEASSVIGLTVRSWRRYESGEREMDGLYWAEFKRRTGWSGGIDGTG